nr:hypothetical protein [Cystobacter sp.]
MHPITFIELIHTWGMILSLAGIVLGPFILNLGMTRKSTPSSLFFLTLGGVIALTGVIGLSMSFKQGESKLKAALQGPVGKPLDMSFTELASGNQGSLATWSGKVVLLQFWASWNDDASPPMRELEQVLAELGGSDLAVVALSDEPRDVLLAQPSVPQGLVRGTFELETLPMPLRGMAVMRPVSVLIDQQGIVRGVFVGRRTATFLADQIREYL